MDNTMNPTIFHEKQSVIVTPVEIEAKIEKKVEEKLEPVAAVKKTVDSILKSKKK